MDDVHAELVERDFHLLEWLLSRTNPAAVVLEYTRAESRLIDQVRTSRALLDSAKSPLRGAL